MPRKLRPAFLFGRLSDSQDAVSSGFVHAHGKESLPKQFGEPISVHIANKLQYQQGVHCTVLGMFRGGHEMELGMAMDGLHRMKYYDCNIL